MLEKDITNKIMKYLKTVPACFAWKTHGGMYGTAGMPDIVCCIGGRFVGLEVKQPGKKLTALQEDAINRINAAGGIAAMVTSVGEVKEILMGMNDKSL